MGVDDQEPPVHRISRIEGRERLLAEAMAHAEAHEAQFRVLPASEPLHGRWKTPLALLILVVSGLFAAFPPERIAGPLPPSVQQGDLELGLRAAVYLQASQVEVFRLRTGRLPESLAELPTHLPGLRLVRSNNRVYQIVGRRPGGGVVVYDSAHPARGFAAAASGWADEAGP